MARPQDFRPALASLALCLSAVLASNDAVAQSTPPTWAQQQPANEQVIVPQVDRREIKLPKIPSNDFSFGLFGGTYSTQNFGSSAVGGLRAGYHITEDFFVEAAYAQTKVSDDNYRQILPGGIFPQEKTKLTYYNLSVGYNLLPGEIFIGKNIAKATALYLIGGVGSTKIDTQRRQTFNVGFGLRVFLADWAALQLDVRDHIFSLDILGKRETTQNPELTAGVTFFF
ncbi:MAG TPA: outer membrane beta-barrel domain-containing protein [Methylibium sp.]|uniref:outer membrane beta-barrel domain-containing protein n=1 Tax=Methylibium sp. TaxID=2067992 RepID=UPI002DB9ADF4|nr:outer membrane beta-barrel domain-containing protein [Methylibium sp.]HEU4459175.1 outer membrane beta-barrel domain-containing protein [Methylibium sp.]